MNAMSKSTISFYSEAAANFLHPLSQFSPAGEDLSYSIIFDDIREARRSDDADLTQREWVTEIKTSDWNRVQELCGSALKSRTKDMQLAAWYAEAMTHLQGFSGLTQGLEILHGLISRYWDSVFPVPDDGNFDERCAKIEWLNAQLPVALLNVPVTSPSAGLYTYLQWKESRWVENIGLKDAKAKADAIAEGKLSGDIFDKSARQSGIAFYEVMVHDSQRALSVLDTLTAAVEEKLGDNAPSMGELRNALMDCVNLADRLHADVGGRSTSESNSAGNLDSASVAMTSDSQIPRSTQGVARINSRKEAVQSLRDAAQYFRLNEPHSPVSLLADRAAKWAEMSLEQWLGAVIKDDGTLSQLRELLDIRSEP